MNTDELERALFWAERRVLEIQTKLHRWARDDVHRRFDGLFNLVADPAFLLVGWDRVRGNKGARTAGVDGQTAHYVEAEVGVETFLDQLRTEIKDRSFCPLPSRERMISQAGTTKRRRLGISTVRDGVVQASLKLELEPIFQADFLPCSYGFRPKRRTHDVVAEIRLFTARSNEWVVEGDIKACFDEISRPALMDRVRRRVGDKRVLALVKAFLKAGILDEARTFRETDAGSPQGSILSPLLSNVALSVLDEHIAYAPGGPGISRNDRLTRRRHGRPNYRLVRYADDWCLLVSGTRDGAEAMREEIAGVLSTMGLRLSPEKTLITHIDKGLDFPGWHIQRRRKRGTQRRYVYPVLRGWTAHFRPGVSSAAFGFLRAFSWRQVVGWLRRKHSRMNWKELRRRFLAGGWWPTAGKMVLFNPFRGCDYSLPLPGNQDSQPVAERPMSAPAWTGVACGEPDASMRRTSGSEGGSGKRIGGTTDTAPRADPTT